MELETMFTEQKWNILKCLSKEKYSPLQLAEKLDTSMANISQQLRLLEAVNLVKKEKIKNRDKGKPRSLFSLTGDHAYLISTMKGFTNKRLLKATGHHKIILKIWMLEDSELQYSIERLYWKIEPHIKDIDVIAIDSQSKEVFVISDNVKEVDKLIDKYKYISVRTFSKAEAQKLINQNKEPFSSSIELTVIYDPNNMINSNVRGDS